MLVQEHNHVRVQNRSPVCIVWGASQRFLSKRAAERWVSSTFDIAKNLPFGVPDHQDTKKSEWEK
jgi:hypothetical protein